MANFYFFSINNNSLEYLIFYLEQLYIKKYYIYYSIIFGFKYLLMCNSEFILI